VTPTTDTNKPGRGCTQVDSGRALHARPWTVLEILAMLCKQGVGGRVPLAPPPSAPMTSQVSDLTSRASPSPVSLGLILAVPACSLAWDLR